MRIFGSRFYVAAGESSTRVGLLPSLSIGDEPYFPVAESSTMKKEELLALDGDITWLWCHEYFIETSEGNFIWSSPGYDGGDNTIRPCDVSLNEYLRSANIPFGRGKGWHAIVDYCGKNIVMISPQRAKQDPDS